MYFVISQSGDMQRCGQLCLSSNQTTRFFDHQYLWKESIDLLDHLVKDNHQLKVVYETTSFGWMWPVVPLIQ